MEKLNIYKYKNFDINKLNVESNNLIYESNSFLIQTPIFTDYEIINYNDKKYLELKIDETKISHINFLTLIDSIELKMNNELKNKQNNQTSTKSIKTQIKTQIITNIQNKKSLKVKIIDSTLLFDSNKEIVSNLYSNKISLLLKIDYFTNFYSWIVFQILQLR